MVYYQQDGNTCCCSDRRKERNVTEVINVDESDLAIYMVSNSYPEFEISVVSRDTK